MATVKVTEQKVILCGEYGVGKTSIFRRFANNTFVTSSDRKSTLGLDNIDKEYVVEDRRIRVTCLYIYICICLSISTLNNFTFPHIYIFINKSYTYLENLFYIYDILLFTFILYI